MNNGHPSASIVVINDDLTLLHFITGTLKEERYRVYGFTTAEKALLHIAERGVPSLIITDLYMPGIDGWRLVRLLRSPEFPELNRAPILVVSATYASEEAHRITRDLGANAFLPLPVNHTRLRDTVQSLLQGEPTLSKLTALVVDDSEIVRILLRDAFENGGYSARSVASLAEADEYLNGTVPDVAVIDYHLPDGMGDVLLDRLVSMRKHAAVVMITSDPRPELALDWMRRGASAYARKPFDPDYLVQLCLKAQQERALLRVEERLEQRTRELSESETRYRMLYGGLTDSVLVYGLDERNRPGRFLEVNDVACERLGYSREEMLLMTPSDIEFPNSGIGVEANIERLKRGETVLFEQLLASRSGLPIPVEINSRSFEIDGKPAVISIVRDISERKEAARELEKRENDYHRLVSMANEGVWSTDREFVTNFVNQRMAEMLGRTQEDIVGRRVDEFMPEGEWDSHLKQMSQRRSGGSSRYERKFVRADGSILWTEVTAVPLHDDQGVFNGSLALFTDITERKRAEVALRESEAQYRILMETSPDVVFRFDRDYRILYASPAVIRYINHPAEALIGKTNRELDCAPESCDQWERLIRTVFETGEVQEEEKEHRWFRNDVVFNLRLIPERAENGETVSVFAILRDISANRRLEQDYELLFSTMVEGFALHEMIFDDQGKAVDYRFLSVNPAFERMTGLKAEHLVGKTVLQIMPGTETYWIEAYGQVVLTGDPLHYENYARELEKHYEVIAYRPAPGQFATIVRDVSEKKRADALLLESEERYRAISEYSHNAICIIDDHGKFVWANNNMVTMGGYTMEQLHASPSFIDFIAPESREFVVANFQNAMQGQEYEHHYRFWFVRADGEKRIAEKYMMDITSRYGARLLVISMLDITEQVRYEEERAIMQEQLTQALKMESIGRLAGGVAHDFNNMLAIILGYAEMMIAEIKPDHSFYEGLEQILEAGRRSRDLTRQLLAFARKQTLELRRLDLNTVVNNFEKMLRRTLRENVRVEKYLDPAPCVFRGDVGQIEQVMLNLSVNSQDAMPEGGSLLIETGHATLDEEYVSSHTGVVPGEYVVLSLSDTGCGMDDETLKRIFDPFFTTKEMGRGTGLGLSTVYGIVKQHDGHVGVYSEPGRGTTFRVYLPLAQGEVAPKPTVSEVARSPLGDETILLAEDQEHVRILATRLLERKGYRVLAAHDGASAIAIADSTVDQIHMMITDVVMPDMNGKALYETLRIKRPSLRVLYMSGYTANIISHHGVLDPGVNYIQKPFDLALFISKVRSVLDG
jgi:PAS domain S-box-containing protein